jgi:tryptophan synthase
MAEQIRQVFGKSAELRKPVFVAYVMAGFETRSDTVPTLRALQDGGADIIELGVPFTDPIADGPTIQIANQKAVDNKVTLKDVLQYVRDARLAGVTVPIVLMGYCNPVVNYGERELVRDARDAGANGFIVVDCPPEEAINFREHCKEFGMSYIPLICPTTSDLRIKKLAALADSFIYCLSVNGVTGVRAELPAHLSSFVHRVRKYTPLPIAVGFGISSREHFLAAATVADGVVIGSAIIKAISHSPAGDNRPQHEKAKAFARSITVA